MTEIGKKIKEVRKIKGLSQEELAEAAKVNLRTIQRIENNKSEPRGKTLNLICEVLGLNTEDIFDYGKHSDNTYLIYFQLSVLAGLVIPVGNIIVPLILWMNQKDKIKDLKEIGTNLLNFQIFWTFLVFITLITGAFLKITHTNIGIINVKYIFYLWGFYYLINIILPILFALKIKKGKIENFYPTVIKFIK